MLYKLLRDNYESGPYTKSELMNMELLSSDFLRPDVEGSKWILASKFSELKNKLETDKPKPKYKITADGQLIEITQNNKDTGNKNDQLNTEDEIETKNADASPFRRAPSAVPKKRFQENDAPFDYLSKNDSQPSNSRNTSTKYAPKTATVEEAPKSKKTAGNILKEVIIPIAILGAIFGGWMIYNNRTDNGSKETKASISAMFDDTDNTNLPTKDANNTTKNSSEDITTIPVQIPTNTAADDSIAVLREKREILRRKNDSIALAIAHKKRTDSIASAQAKVEKNNQEKITQPATVEEKPKVTAETPKKTETAKTDTKEETAKTPAKKSNLVGDYVRLSLNNPAKKGYANAKIKVNNVSKSDLNVAVLKVRYLDAKGNVLKSETIQVDNIKAGRSVIVGIPDHKTAEKISYGATMVSGDDVYIMRQ